MAALKLVFLCLICLPIVLVGFMCLGNLAKYIPEKKTEPSDANSRKVKRRKRI